MISLIDFRTVHKLICALLPIFTSVTSRNSVEPTRRLLNIITYLSGPLTLGDMLHEFRNL